MFETRLRPTKFEFRKHGKKERFSQTWLMESTPFDEAPDELVAPVPLDKQSGAPMQPRPRRPLLWIVPLAVIALILAGVGFHFQRQNAANSARSEIGGFARRHQENRFAGQRAGFGDAR